MRLVRGIAVLSVASVGVLGLAACGSGTDAPSSTPSAASAGQKAPATKDAPAELTAENFAQRITDAQIAAGSVTMSTSATQGPETADITADIVFTETSQNLAMSLVGPESGEIQIRLVDDMVYVKAGEMTQGKFLALDPSDESNLMASSFQGVLDQMDPTASIEALDGAIVSVEKDGEPVDLDGVEVQPYAVVVDTTQLTGPTKEQAEAAGADLPETLTYQYWIDADDLMHKVVTDVQGTAVEVRFSHWGDDLQVVAPSAEEITTTPTP